MPVASVEGERSCLYLGIGMGARSPAFSTNIRALKARPRCANASTFWALCGNALTSRANSPGRPTLSQTHTSFEIPSPSELPSRLGRCSRSSSRRALTDGTHSWAFRPNVHPASNYNYRCREASEGVNRRQSVGPDTVRSAIRSNSTTRPTATAFIMPLRHQAQPIRVLWRRHSAHHRRSWPAISARRGPVAGGFRLGLAHVGPVSGVAVTARTGGMVDTGFRVDPNNRLERTQRLCLCLGR